MYVINLPLFFRRSSRITFHFLRSRVSGRRKKKSFSNVIDAGCRKRVEKVIGKGPIVPIKRDTHRFPIITSFYRKTRSSNRGKPHPIFSIVFLLYPPISYIIAESRDRQFHVGWNVTSLLTLTI